MYVHRHGVGGKTHAELGIKMVDGFHQADTPDLKQVVRRFAATLKTLDHRQHQPQIAADQFITRLLVAAGRTPQQRIGLCGSQHRQSGGIHPADLHLGLHGKVPPVSCVLSGFSPASRTNIPAKYFAG